MPLCEVLTWNPILAAALFAISACFATWRWVAARRQQRLPILPYEPRRPVPWQAIDIAVVLAFYLSLEMVTIGLANLCLDPNSTFSIPNKSTSEHVVSRLLSEGNPWVLLLCIVSAGVVAPIAEEFFFRVLLQGWLESLEHRWRRRLHTLRRWLPRGAVPILLTSLLFARLHFRVDSPQIDAQFLIFLLAGDAVARVLTIVFAVAWLRWRVAADTLDFGWAPRKLSRDAALGVVTFAAIAAPIYAVQMTLFFLLPENIAPDPVPLFLLALVLGALYYRTHRLVPLIALHAALNATSLALAWLAS